MEIFKIFVTILGVCMSLGYFPQAYKIYKLKSAKEISLINYSVLSFGNFVWFLYGVLTSDMVLIVSFAVAVVGSWTILGLVIKYR